MFLQFRNKEPLKRKIIWHLFKIGYLDIQKPIIDIGCYLADNTLVWAKCLDENAVVYAIDPCKENLEFGKKLGKLNGISNVQWVHAVCSSSEGTPLEFSGPSNHRTFREAKIISDNLILSTTLDNIVQSSDNKEISLINLDVEGFEERVLLGAEQIIKSSRPTIVFEQHICSENISHIIKFLTLYDYKIFMINEVTAGACLDCRNFIAFDNKKAIPKCFDIEHHLGQRYGVYYASLNDALIPLCK